MKIIRFERGGTAAYGVLEGESVRAILGGICGDFQVGDKLCALDEVKLLPPVQPSIVVCVAANYYCLQEELGREIPKMPELFFKPASSVIGHLDQIVYPEVSNSISCGGELAVIMQSEARQVPEERALEYVLGYTCAIDVTALDLLTDRFPTRAKSYYTFCSLGPYIATAVDGDNLLMKSYVNGNRVLNHSTSGMIFGVAQVISCITQFMTLQPLDVVLMGTPKPETPINAGDVIDVELQGIGTLRNTVSQRK